ncbi:MAG: transposase, partial [Gammaproteobacteria bacterium]
RIVPREFMQRFAALVPRPRLHLIRFHGVLAPTTRLRPEIVPVGAVNVNVSSEHVHYQDRGKASDIADLVQGNSVVGQALSDRS